MAHKNQIAFIHLHQNKIKEPILLIGSKLYDYDQYDLAEELRRMGFQQITGTDISAGMGVDHELDITDDAASFIQQFEHSFGTIICMEVLTNVSNPFKAAENINRMLKTGGYVVLSECFVRKLSRMPVDYWRFTYDGLKALFPGYIFLDAEARYSIIRQKDAGLKPYTGQFDEILIGNRHLDESGMHFLLRRAVRKCFGKGIFLISRLLPEQTSYAIGQKPVRS